MGDSPHAGSSAPLAPPFSPTPSTSHSPPAVEDSEQRSPTNPRQAAIATLRRAASTRERPPTSSTSPPRRVASPSSSRSPPPSRSRPRASTTTRSTESASCGDDDDTSLFPLLPTSSTSFGPSQLERTASLLARQTALAKLTGTTPPTPPRSFFTAGEELPTLEELQRRARAKLDQRQQQFQRGIGLEDGESRRRGGAREGTVPAMPTLRRNNTVATNQVSGASRLEERNELAILATTGGSSGPMPVLRRNNTVTGIGVQSGQESIGIGSTRPGGGDPAPPVDGQGGAGGGTEERTQARVNLMRKLSARRLGANASPSAPAPAPRPSLPAAVAGSSSTAAPPAVPVVPPSPPSTSTRDRLAVVGRIGRARPRSGSVGAIERGEGEGGGGGGEGGEALNEWWNGIGISMDGPPRLGRTIEPSRTAATSEQGDEGPTTTMTDVRSETPSTQRSSISTSASASSGRGGGGGGLDDGDAWEFDHALQPPRPRISGDLERPGSEVEVVRDSQAHYPPRAPPDDTLDSEDPTLDRSDASHYTPSLDRTPKATWIPSFFPSSTALHPSQPPGSAASTQTARFPGPSRSGLGTGAGSGIGVGIGIVNSRYGSLDDDAISPNTSPAYPGPDWPTDRPAHAHARGEPSRRPRSSSSASGVGVVPRDFGSTSSSVHLDAPSRPSVSSTTSNPIISSSALSPSASSTSSVSSSSTSTSSPPPNLDTLHDLRNVRPIPTFGIAAVEGGGGGAGGVNGGGRKRGSSASSSLTWLEKNRKNMARGSDAQLLFSKVTVDGRGGFGSGSASTVGSGSASAADSLKGGQTGREGGQDAMEELRKGKARDGGFPPPEKGYQFPGPLGPNASGAEEASRTDAHALFEQLGRDSPRIVEPSPQLAASPASKPSPNLSIRGKRDFPFKLPFQPSSFPSSLSDSPILPDPISPTSVISDPFSNLGLVPPAGYGSLVPSSSEVMDRQPSARSNRSAAVPNPLVTAQTARGVPTSQEMVKSPSLESTATSSAGGNSSTYHSPVAMRRDLSSSSNSSSTSFFLKSPRVAQLPADQLPANRILAKLDSLLGTEQLYSPSASSPSPSSLLDTPPRKLLLHAPVLQVVNANTVKDRYLFLFTDMLVIAKPLIADHPLTGEPIEPTLENQFLVKSVVELRHLKIVATEDLQEETSASNSKKRHPLLVAFIDRFANEPSRAIASLVQKGGLANDAPTISNLLFKNTDLNRNQLGAYLANPNHRHVLRSYIERFRFGGVRIDDALRLFLMSVRLPPQDRKAAEYVLGVLANVWAETNLASGFDPSLAFSLIVAILRLSDALHSGQEREHAEGPILPASRGTQALSVDDFVTKFREHDARMVVPEDLLSRIYTSVRRERIEQASDNSIFSMTPDIEANLEPAKLPTHLTYRTASEVFTITIPAPDTKFSIKLAGPDLIFDPPVLSFARSATQSFRVTGTALGVRVMVLIKRGANAPRYQGLPLNKAFSIERAFMQNTFQAAFTNHLDVKRKYMFSVSDPSIRAVWLSTFRTQISQALANPPPVTPALAAARAVATQVLRDVFLPPEEPAAVPPAAPSPRPNLAAPRFGPPVTPSTPRARLGTPTRTGAALARSNSTSKMYASKFKHEADLSDRKQSLITGQLRPNGIAGLGSVKDEVAVFGASPFAKTGRALVLTTEQNSLLPLVLSFLNTGLEVAPHPLSLDGSAFQLPALPPSTAAVPSSFPLVGLPPFSH
ncbi:hypothetical protein JCM10212_005531 [Sporobolomyces blumeae]